MKTLQIITSLLVISILCFWYYVVDTLDTLHYWLKDTRDKHFRLVWTVQENMDVIRSLKKELYGYEVMQAENILRKSKKYWTWEVVFLDFKEWEVLLQLNDQRYWIDIENKIITNY